MYSNVTYSWLALSSAVRGRAMVLLDGVAGVPALNQPDGIHPTAKGHRKLADTVWKALQPLLAS